MTNPEEKQENPKPPMTKQLAAPKPEKFRVTRKLVWWSIWTACTIVMLIFIYRSYEEYVASNPVTLVTFVQQPERPDPVIVKICNHVFFDEEKIRNYNGTEIDEDLIQFLKQTVSMESTFNSSWVDSTALSDTFLMPPEVFEFFKLDLSKFLLSCYIPGQRFECSREFKFFPDSDTPCYKAEIQLTGHGINQALTLGFFFDPEIKFGKFSKSSSGAFVVFHHPNDVLQPQEGVQVSSEDYIIVKTEVEQKFQKESMEKAKCAASEGLVEYNFTGSPFQVEYHPSYCIRLCQAQTFYKLCNCTGMLGLNITKSECILRQETRQCVIDNYQSIDDIEKLSRSCFSTCLPKCKQKKLQTQVFRQQQTFTAAKLTKMLVSSVRSFANNSYLMQKFLKSLDSAENPQEKVEEILPNIAHLTFYFHNNQQQLLFEVIPFMTFPTFLSNVGGLMGMWLGLSAISVLEFLDQKIHLVRTFWTKTQIAEENT